jgi:2-dehydro-3-deoxyphosphooctonate aldolase (KDO 8-P synthase)
LDSLEFFDCSVKFLYVFIQSNNLRRTIFHRKLYYAQSTVKKHESSSVQAGSVLLGGKNPLVLIAGPCVVESRELILKTARAIDLLSRKYKIPCIFKSSYKKANRSSKVAFSTIGVEKALKILAEVRTEFGMPVLTDIHTAEEAELAAEFADVIQIPAFLCRQTDLLIAAGDTGKTVNIKKGQFLAPEDMKHAADKVASTGNRKIILTERGTTFGYHNLVVDIKSFPIMRSLGYPVVLDATHSVQLPGGEKDRSGGQPEFIFPIARAGVAAGCDAVFIETHPNPEKALSDAASQLKLSLLESLIIQLQAIDNIVRPLDS